MKIAIIGCGHMGGGIAQRLHTSNLIQLYDHNSPKVRELASHTESIPCHSVEEAIRDVEVILLAVKPQDFKEIAPSLKKSLTQEQLMMSLLAGVSLKTIQDQISTPIVRMMPNLAVLCGEGIVGLTAPSGLDEGLKKQAEQLSSALGSFYWLPEEKLDALTSLTGSGPAFICVWIEAMTEAAIAMGFRADEGTHLALEVLKGTLALLEEPGNTLESLKYSIASPAGTTIAGLLKMEEMGVRSGIIQTFLAAYKRTKELA